MSVVFIHGVPDTYRIWNSVINELSRTDILALALPGFDSPIPPCFTATKEDYVDWIVEQLEQQSAPVDLVGHDWGCILSARVASLRPDLIRTWAAGGGPVSKVYEWHPLAKIFQTPGEGEEYFAKLNPAEFSQFIQSDGVAAELADEVVKHIDGNMAECILKLYRSALTVGAEWEPGLPDITSPSLIMWGSSDPACPVEFADRLGQSTRARRILKLECGHWFPSHKPTEIAQALEEHWRSADVL
jgi:pimeloyl-ACP methyl ester carboxylesterase